MNQVAGLCSLLGLDGLAKLPGSDDQGGEVLRIGLGYLDPLHLLGESLGGLGSGLERRLGLRLGLVLLAKPSKVPELNFSPNS